MHIVLLFDTIEERSERNEKKLLKNKKNKSLHKIKLFETDAR